MSKPKKNREKKYRPKPIKVPSLLGALTMWEETLRNHEERTRRSIENLSRATGWKTRDDIIQVGVLFGIGWHLTCVMEKPEPLKTIFSDVLSDLRNEIMVQGPIPDTLRFNLENALPSLIQLLSLINQAEFDAVRDKVAEDKGIPVIDDFFNVLCEREVLLKEAEKKTLEKRPTSDAQGIQALP